MKYVMTELNVPAAGMPQTESTEATPSLTTFWKLLQALHIFLGQSQIPQLTSRQGSTQMRLASEQPLADNHIVLPMPTVVLNLLALDIAMPVLPVCFYPCL